ncbi:MAG TPA: P-loop NTPase fold protein [Nitrosopumilaceae archaeon]|nr:P-loop NTPase fold protein [Nitrosopumilaceae archaeon]
MEVSDIDKSSKWKNILNKLHNTKNQAAEKLIPVKTQIDVDQSHYNNTNQKETVNLEQPKTESQKNNEKRTDYAYEMQLINHLHQKEIGDFSRLESIKNYLMVGQQLLHEDRVYLQDQYEQLKKVLKLNDQFNSSTESRTRTAPLQPQAILIDDVEEAPTHDFISLSKTISNLIRNSTPHFTIGIYGEWGTGKTTLMKSIETNLQAADLYEGGEKILPIWFNAWKYEREDSLATVSLLKTVGYAMAGHQRFDTLSKTIFKGLTIVSKDMMQQIAMQVVSKQNSIDDEEIDQKMDYLNKLYRDSVYYEGLDKIKEEISSIREKDPECRVVIFIDDLDRCSPNKALEVLESIKLFLDLEGFVFVIGLSHKTVTQLITRAYETTGIKGEDYIKKIIQIPIKIPSWSKESIIDLIENSITPRLNSDYTKFLSQNSAMIAKVIDYNPRQLKRFINNVIIAFETFTSKEGSPEIQFNEIFLVKILKSEWPDFYREYVTNKDFRDILRWMVTRPRELRKYFKYLRTPTEEFPIEQKNKRQLFLQRLIERTNGRVNSPMIDILSDFDNDTWFFFDNVKDVLFGIQNWKIIDSVMDVVEEFSYEIPIGSNKSKEQKVTQPTQI